MKNLQTFREPVKIDSASQIVVYGNKGTENQARNQEAITGLCWASLLKLGLHSWVEAVCLVQTAGLEGRAACHFPCLCWVSTGHRHVCILRVLLEVHMSKYAPTFPCIYALEWNYPQISWPQNLKGDLQLNLILNRCFKSPNYLLRCVL